MSNISDRMQWSYPEKDQDPWYDVFESMVNGQDASAYASREDRNLIFASSAGFTFDAGSDLISWDAPITVVSSTTGFYVQIAAGSATLLDSQVLYVTVTRAQSGNISVSAQVAAQVPNTDDDYAIAVRTGTSVYFRNGKRLDDGMSGYDIFGAFSAVNASDATKGVTKLSVAAADPGNPIACGDNDPRLDDDRVASGIRTADPDPVDVAAAAAPSQYQVLRATSATTATWQTMAGSTGEKICASNTCLGLAESHNSAVPRVTGAAYIDLTQMVLSGTSMAAFFDVVIACGNSPLTVHAKLRNVTGAYDVKTLDLVDTVNQTHLQAALTFSGAPTPGAGEIDDSIPSIYEVSIWVDAPAGPLDTVELSSASFSVVNTIL